MKLLKKDKDILLYLYSSEWVTAKELAEHFNISERTVKARIKGINSFNSADGEVVFSSKKGYKLNPDSPSAVSLSMAEDLNADTAARVRILIGRLLKERSGIDRYQLADELFISESTLDRDLHKAEKELCKFSLSILKNNQMILIDGSEKNKRKWITHSIYEESTGSYLELTKIQSSYYGYDLPALKSQVQNILEHYQLYVNGYTFNSIILHCIVAIDRVANDNHLIQKICEESVCNLKEYQAAQDIAAMFEQEYSVHMNQLEVQSLAILLTGKTTLIANNAYLGIPLTDLDETYLKLVDRILYKINQQYYLSFNDQDFRIKFTLHIKNLCFRLHTKQIITNPLTRDIKHSYPLIYDLAVFVSNELKEYTGYDVAEDEITYLAFHLGSYFEYSKENENKIKVVLVCPSYYGMQLDFADRILNYFREDIVIETLITDPEYLIHQYYQDLILSVIDLPISSRYLKVTPFISEADRELIQLELKSLHIKKQEQNLKKVLEQYFSPELFLKNMYFKNEFDMIEQMGTILLEQKRIDIDFIEQVKRREKMSSTVFGNGLAMPHSMEMSAKKTSVFIVVNDKKLKWGEEYVQVIALIAMNSEERQDFKKIFNSLIEVLSKKENINYLTESTDYDNFIKRLLSCFPAS
jgi:Transcriptional antiterminator